MEYPMPQPDPSSPDPQQRPEDAPLESPMPRSPTLDNEEPELGNEADIPPERPKSAAG
jgi:hypothetical protein